METTDRYSNNASKNKQESAGCMSHLCIIIFLAIIGLFCETGNSEILAVSSWIAILFVILHGLWKLVDRNY